MFKKIRFLIGLLTFCFFFSTSNTLAQQSFDKFWTKFKLAVVKNDKKTVADLTVFPLIDESENDEGANPSISRSKFLKQYHYFFNRKIKQCFQKPKFYFNGKDKSEKIISCETAQYINFSFMFKKYRSGWKWINFNTD